MNNETAYAGSGTDSDLNSDSRVHLAPTDDTHETSHLHFVLNIPPRNVLLLMLVWVRDSQCVVSMALIFLRQAYNHRYVLRMAAGGASLTSHPARVTRALGDPASVAGLFRTCPLERRPCLLYNNRTSSYPLEHLPKLILASERGKTKSNILPKASGSTVADPSSSATCGPYPVATG